MTTSNILYKDRHSSYILMISWSANLLRFVCSTPAITCYQLWLCELTRLYKRLCNRINRFSTLEQGLIQNLLGCNAP